MTNPERQFHTTFPQIKSCFEQRPFVRDSLICKQGFYNGCFVLKLQKASWTNDRMDQIRNDTGIFFSIWIDEEAASKNQAHYNIHALKLRRLKGYSIASRGFADDFRNSFASVRDDWPNVSVEYGPLTLMQGWIELDPNSYDRDILALMERFEQVSPLIDRLLELRRRRTSRTKRIEKNAGERG